MKWAHAASVLRRAIAAMANPAPDQTAASTGACGLAPPTGPTLNASGPWRSDLTARAVRLCNRQPQAVARYLRVHEILRAGTRN
jgi:hypothetical protein